MHIPQKPPPYLSVKIGMFNLIIPETVNCIKKYQFVEVGMNHWRNAFTEIKKLGARYAIRSIMATSWSVSNEEDMESFVKYYIRLS